MQTRARLVAVALAFALVASEARAVEIVALDESNTLYRFDSSVPSKVTVVAVSGVNGTLIGIDQRPANRLLYGLSTTNDVYTIDHASGAAALVSTLTVAFDGGTHSGFDFNPQVDRLRIVGGPGQNLRVHVNLGAAATDTPLRYAAGDANAGKRPAIAAAAYTNSVADAPTTKLFDIDCELDVLALQDPPNDGLLVTIGALGADFGPLAGFDIVREGERDRGFAVSGSVLYEIDLATGRAGSLGTVGIPTGTNLIGLAALQAPGGARR